MKKQMLGLLGAVLFLTFILWYLEFNRHVISTVTINNIRDALLAILEIIALFLFIICMVVVVRWLIRKPDGMVILPFEIVNGEAKDSEKFYSGKSIADALTSEMILIANIHSQEQIQSNKETTDKPQGQYQDASPAGYKQSFQTGSLEDLPLTSQNIFRPQANIKLGASETKALGEGLSAGFAEFGTVAVSGNSISIGRLLMTLKQLMNDCDPRYVISGSMQRYGNTVQLISRLKAVGENIIVCEVTNTIKSEEEIPDLIKDLAFKIWKEIPKTWKNIKGTVSDTWIGLKYFTEALFSYNNFKLSGQLADLDKTLTNCFNASQAEKAYQNLYPLCFSVALDFYDLKDYAKSIDILNCALRIQHDQRIKDPGRKNNDELCNTYVALGACYFNIYNYSDAEYSFRRALELNSLSYDAYYNLSLVLFNLGMKEEAKGQLEKARSLNVVAEKDFLATGDWYDELGFKEDAIGQFQMWLENDPKNELALYRLGNLYTDLGLNDEAFKKFRQVLDLNPSFTYKNSNPHNDLGFLHGNVGQEQKAIEEYSLAIKQDPEFALAFSNLGSVYYDTGETELAILQYLRAIHLDDELIIAIRNLAIAYAQLGNVGDAVNLYQKAISLDITNVNLHVELGNILFTSGELEKAQASYQEALNLDKENPEVYAAFGYIYRQKGEVKKAIRSFLQAIQLKPDVTDFYIGLGEIYRREHSFSEAKKIYEEAIQLEKGNPHFLMCLADCFRNEGNMDEYENIRKLTVPLLDQWKPDEYNHSCYESLCGNTEQAINYLRIALDKKLQSFEYVQHDIDFDGIKNEPLFKKFLREYLDSAS